MADPARGRFTANVRRPEQLFGAASASLATPNENTAVTHASLTLDGTAIAYTATAGHLSALDEPVARGVDLLRRLHADGAAAATRPVTFFFNGGPGSASAYLHLGSFAPKRLVTGEPATTQTVPFPYVDNAESLIDTSDLVFVDASAPACRRRSRRTPTRPTGASTSTPPCCATSSSAGSNGQRPHRVAAVPLRRVLRHHARAGAHAPARDRRPCACNGVVEQSSIVDYNSNCSVEGGKPTVNCAGFLPTYAAVGAYWHLATGATSDLDADLATVRSYADATYEPDAAMARDGTLPPPIHVAALVAFTGLPDGVGQQFDMDYDTFRHNLIANTVLGVYDGRMSALVGSALDADDDPSNTFVEPGFRPR
jgi:hypothetical protein